MKINTKLNKNGKEDYIVLEEEYLDYSRMFGMLNAGGSIVIGNYAIMFEPVDKKYIRTEIRYVPKGNFYTPEYFYKKKKKKFSITEESKKEGDVEL